ncbi:hypothetical protein AKJ35_00835 [candidate division MSBL1 archaeon SCGC-AAA833F18]|uniref:Phosphoesterase n=1 Tax=candidate division MSBL1 archaeon SCGC-AAA833F18 TaxID=1698257 RepID=A0A133VSL7_9EURY|nr:hypothetical protein AKJ35_00835 [candidate division MSBL1 archaeon SCGC-AAA833F18]
MGVIADPHSNLPALKAVLDHMPKVDQIICVGDLVGYGAEPNEVVETVKSKDISSVMGNHDHAAVTGKVSSFNPYAAKAALWTGEALTNENQEFLENLPREVKFKEGKWEIYMVHGSPRRPLTEYILPGISNQDLVRLTKEINADVVILGHTHVPLERRIMGKLIINPGAVGQPRDRDPRASYMVLKLGRKLDVEHKRVSYNVEEAAQKIMKAGLPEELATRLNFGW